MARTNAEIEKDAVAWLRGVGRAAELFSTELARGTEEDPPRASGVTLNSFAIVAALAATITDDDTIVNHAARRQAFNAQVNQAFTTDMLLHQGWTPASIPRDPRPQRTAVATLLERFAGELSGMLDGEGAVIEDQQAYQALAAVVAVAGAAADAVKNGWATELSLNVHALSQRLEAAAALRGSR